MRTRLELFGASSLFPSRFPSRPSHHIASHLISLLTALKMHNIHWCSRKAQLLEKSFPTTHIQHMHTRRHGLRDAELASRDTRFDVGQWQGAFWSFASRNRSVARRTRLISIRNLSYLIGLQRWRFSVCHRTLEPRLAYKHHDNANLARALWPSASVSQHEIHKRLCDAMFFEMRQERNKSY